MAMRCMMTCSIALALALTGCGGDAEQGGADAAAGGTVSQGTVAREMANAPQLRPGAYAITMNAVRFDVPGMPPEQAQMMQQMMAGVAAQQQTQCITEAESRRSLEDMYKGLGEGQCTMQRFDISGSTMSGEMQCSGGSNRTSNIRINGEMTRESSNTTMVMAMSDPSLPQGTAEMEMRVSMRRTGDCTAGAGAAR